jgi:CDP-diacylglycerol--glycerol-3-phosphate 3-phosphatidyltransferase
MFRHVPNLITGGRLLLAGVFFAMLAVYQYEGRGDPWYLNTAFIIYCVALFTDFLDGYLARKWKVEGAFGRVVDPFVDKILVLGSFIFFAGKNFIIPETGPGGQISPTVVRTITGVAPGMVVLILARELLVTTFRGMGEAGGQAFGAAYIGKVKMVLQSVTILVILVYVNYYGWIHKSRFETSATWFRDLCIWVTIGITVYSGLDYIRKAAAMLRDGPPVSSSGGPPPDPRPAGAST